MKDTVGLANLRKSLNENEIHMRPIGSLAFSKTKTKNSLSSSMDAHNLHVLKSKSVTLDARRTSLPSILKSTESNEFV